MLTGIGLRNFKAFGDEMQEAPLSKITLIYGPNSGGKSSIIQALLLLKQSLKSGNQLAPKGEYTDLGSFQSLLHKHDEGRELEISIVYRNLHIVADSARNEVHMTFSDQAMRGKPSRIGYKITFPENNELLLDAIVEEQSPIQFIVPSDQIAHYDDMVEHRWNIQFRILGVSGEKDLLQKTSQNESFLPALRIPQLKHARELAMHELDNLRQKHTLGEEVELSELFLSEELPFLGTLVARPYLQFGALRKALQEAEADLEVGPSENIEPSLEQLYLNPKQTIALTPENIPADYERHLGHVDYLGPLRSAPQRLYSLSNADDTGIQGEDSASVLYHRAQFLGDVLNDVNLWFEQFDIPYELDVIKLGEPSLAGEYITIALTDKRTDTQVTLADVGYGINQILPVIIEGVASQESSILCVEQPEIHLHPRLQANIADLMIDTIADEPGKRKQWIVETHSELLIRRIRTRIAQGDIAPSDVSVLYVDPDDEDCEGSAIKQLRLDENGYWLDEWPHGFFDDGYKQSKLARRARLAKDKKNADKVRS